MTFFPLDFVFYFAIDYSFLFHLCIFNWRRIALRCQTLVFLHVFALCCSCSSNEAVSHWLSVPHHQSEATADCLLVRCAFLLKQDAPSRMARLNTGSPMKFKFQINKHISIKELCVFSSKTLLQVGDSHSFFNVAIIMLRYVPLILVWILLPQVFRNRRLLKLISVILFPSCCCCC